MVFSNICRLKSFVLCAADVWFFHSENTKNLSPINIIRKKTTPKNYPPLTFTNYDIRVFLQVINNGNHLEIRFDCDKLTKNKLLPTLTGGVLASEYILDHIDYHWPSEHLKDGRQYPVEAQFVHYKKCKKSLKKAICDCDLDSVCIVSVLYDIVDVPPHKNLKDCFDYIADKLGCVRTYKPNRSVTTNNKVLLMGLLPKRKDHYFCYNGSLTTKPYADCVIWIVFDEGANIRKYQFDKMIKLTQENGVCHRDNNRSIQPLDNREILHVTSVEGAPPVDGC